MVNSGHNRIQELGAQRIENCLTDIRGRMYRQALFETTTFTFFSGLLLLAALFLLNRVILLPIHISRSSWIVMCVAVIVGICLSFKHRKDNLFVARIVDDQIDSKERLSTALGLMRSDFQGEFAQLQIQDAAETATALDSKKISPYRLPRFLKLSPIPLVLIGLSFAVSPFYEIQPPLTDSQRQVLDTVSHNLAGEHVENSALKSQLAHTVKALKDASDINTAQKHLSNLKKEVRKQQSEQTAITEATETSENFRDMDANQLATALENLAQQAEIPSELQAELIGLFERLAEGLPKGALSDSLNQIQGKAVTPETLRDIIAALEKMEKSSNLAQLEAQLTANQKELALAAIETKSSGGGLANSNGAPGQDAGTSEVQGTRESNSKPDPQPELQMTETSKTESEAGNQDSTTPLTGEETPTLRESGEQLTLTADVSGNATDFSRVFTGEVSDDAPPYLPFADVVLNASRTYAEAVENNRIPVRYQTQIKSYLEAISTTK